MLLRFLLPVLVSLSLTAASTGTGAARDDDDGEGDASSPSSPSSSGGGFVSSAAEERIRRAKLNLWSRGMYALDESALLGPLLAESADEEKADALENLVRTASWRVGPVREARRGDATASYAAGGGGECLEMDCSAFDRFGSVLASALGMRGGGGYEDGGGADAYATRLESKLKERTAKFGADFAKAVARNEREHSADCAESCESYYCAPKDASNDSNNIIGEAWNRAAEANGTSFQSYSMGAVPPEDFAESFGFPLDLIKVTQGTPLFSAEEAAEVIRIAESENVDKNEYQSGKYKLGGDWLTNLPETRRWFNDRLESTFFPLLTYLFPEVVSSPSVLRAHSVSLLKYNSSHPRTDVHIDNGILAMTLAMTPRSHYSGGGTYFEHFGTGASTDPENVLHMDVGHGTFRPGSVRHGGHAVNSGTRYILGAFLLLEDRVEHVRRLKNRGSDLRKSGDLDGAAMHFEWALGLNPKCATCLKDWAELLHAKGEYSAAEGKIREALRLLEQRDSDALFTLGLILSEQGPSREEESIDAYRRSMAINDRDAELCYNLGIKLGGRGDSREEMAMYAKAVEIDPSMGGAWVNWGTALAEAGNMDDAEVMFLKAIECCPDVAPKAMMNVALVHQSRANSLAAGGDVASARDSIVKASRYLDEAKPLLDQKLQQIAASGSGGKGKEGAEERDLASKFDPLRLGVHRLAGQIYAGLQDMDSAEAEFRRAVESYPREAGAWQMLSRVLELKGKGDEAKEAMDRAVALRDGLGGMFGR